MRLSALLFFFFQVLDVKAANTLEDASGYLGESITLHSGANPSWRLTKIKWSILTNNTWIATYDKQKISTDRFHPYKGRLTLNATTGDLTIHNLTRFDDREYNVDLHSSEDEDAANKIKLSVKQKLRQPFVQIVTHTAIENGCLIVMKCSSPDKGVNLSWSAGSHGVLTMNTHNSSDGSVQLFAFVNTTQNFVTFKCTSSRNTEDDSSSSVKPQCDALNCTTQPSPTTVMEPRARFSVSFFIGGFAGGVLTVIIIYFFGGKRETPRPKENVLLVSTSVISPVESTGDSEKIKAACQHIKEKLITSVS